ncbi:TNFAIP3-interacting protein 2 [Xenopus laevis]|uniref:TNFAIP3-interacting protein 2 n=2 Tax=Xenopus laevis TaxID=8355 RepID=A0A1L8HKR2_XENLA|nr:TNFAIP3-interacting protein 2 [Xenopus laevis]OCT96672.1 hypothetical protein XELAEV_18008883mg [Xenopus laevis]
MSSVSDCSTDALLARFKLLEETVDKLHRENRSLKKKLQSCHTLNTFYNEAKLEVNSLKQKLLLKESLIQKLRDKQPLLGPEEPQVSSSQSLVESLMEQLSLMRSKLRDTERTCEEKVEALSQEIKRLHQQVEDKDKQVQQYSSWPQHEKELEICRLQQTLADKERAQATSEVLCRSLSDESQQLRRKLAATAEMCQHLVKCLEETQRNSNRNVEEAIHTERPNKILNLDGSNESSLGKLQEENRLLKQKVVHVEDLNAKWQKYDTSREEYVKGLHLQLKELKARIDLRSSHSAHTHAELMQKEIIRMNKLLEERMKECTKLKLENEEMIGARIADSERIQVLEQQLLVYKDDFISERSDRERAQSRIQELLEQISSLQRQTRRMDDRDAAGNFHIFIGNKNKTFVKKNTTEAPRGSSPEHTEGRRQVAAAAAEAAEAQRNSTSDRRAQDELQCPRCFRIFKDKLGVNFLEHISDCCQ